MGGGEEMRRGNMKGERWIKVEKGCVKHKRIDTPLDKFLRYVPRIWREADYFGSMPQTRYIAPQVKPAPKAVITILSPFLSLCLYSSRQRGIDAAEVLP